MKCISLICYCIAVLLFVIGCPKKSGIEDTVENSDVLSHDIVLIEDVGGYVYYQYLISTSGVCIVKYIDCGRSFRILGQWFSDSYENRYEIFKRKKDGVITRPIFLPPGPSVMMLYLSGSGQEIEREYYSNESQYMNRICNQFRVGIIEDATSVDEFPDGITKKKVYQKYFIEHFADEEECRREEFRNDVYFKSKCINIIVSKKEANSVAYVYILSKSGVYIAKYIACRKPFRLLGQWYSDSYKNGYELFQYKKDGVVTPPFVPPGAPGRIVYLSGFGEEIEREYYSHDSQYMNKICNQLRIKVIEDSNSLDRFPNEILEREVYSKYLHDELLKKGQTL